MVQGRGKSSLSGIVMIALIVAGSMIGWATLRAAQQHAAQTPPAQSTQAASTQPGAPETIHMIVGRSLVISSPARIKRVSVADPSICDAVVVTPNQLVLNAKKAGTSSLVVWGVTGEVQTFDVSVDVDVLGLAQRIRQDFPSQPVRVDVSGSTVTVAGQVSSAPIADKIMDMAKAMTPKTGAVVNLLEVPAPPKGEVLLQVKFAEVDRSALKSLGANFMSLPPAKIIGTTSTQQFYAPALQSGSTLSQSTGGFQLSNLLNVFLFRPDINLAATIQALAQRNVLQILAEPNVLTETGKEASFLAGGQFPIPVLQTTGVGGGVPAITIQWKEFGVRLNFLPVIGQHGMIHLKVAPEVSSLDYSNALTISGFLIPALSTRRVESEMELKDGQSFAIAGLMDNRVTEQLEKIPGIGDIPIIGKLFQSWSQNKSRNELLVMVTPHVVHPLEPGNLPKGPKFPKKFLPPTEQLKKGNYGQ